jgi:hypothetical protein
LGDEISEIEKRIEDSSETRLEHENKDEQHPPTMEEIEKDTKRLNNNRTPGMDNIRGELFKKGGKELLVLKRMHAGMTNVLKVEEMPKDWGENLLYL